MDAPESTGTDWQARYDAGDTPWDKGYPSPGLTEYLQTHGMTGEILVVGCGSGHDVRAIATAQNHVVGLDVAPGAIASAAEYPAKAREEYVCGSVFDLPPGLDGRFDWVWEHTCFCAIEPARREDYVRGVRSALKPGGRLLAVFYMNPDHLEVGPPHGVTVGELASLFGPNFELVEQWWPQVTYPGREERELMRLFLAR